MARVIPNKLTLISHVLCPYVQRSVIALSELGIEFERIDIDLANPPEWFLEISPLGKVPLLKVDDEVVLFESAVIAEFINELADGGLLSTDLVRKAQQRAWIEFASATLDNIGQFYSARTTKSFEQARTGLKNKWRALEDALQHSPFFEGDSFSLVDAAFAPVFRYLDVFEPWFDDPLIELGSKVASWRSQLTNRDSVRNAVSPQYAALLTEFVIDRNSRLGGLAREAQLRQVA